MPNSTTEKPLTTVRNDRRALRAEIIKHHQACEAARGAVFDQQKVAIWHGLQAGIRLAEARELIGHGDWLLWVEANLPFSERTARLYMKIATDNREVLPKSNRQRVADMEPDFKLLSRLKHDTVRKYAIGFVPQKDEPNKHRDVKFPRLVSFLNIVNEYNRLKYRHLEGLQKVDFKEAREETGDLYQFLRWLHGDRPDNPWDS